MSDVPLYPPLLEALQEAGGEGAEPFGALISFGLFIPHGGQAITFPMVPHNSDGVPNTREVGRFVTAEAGDIVMGVAFAVGTLPVPPAGDEWYVNYAFGVGSLDGFQVLTIGHQYEAEAGDPLPVPLAADFDPNSGFHIGSDLSIDTDSFSTAIGIKTAAGGAFFTWTRVYVDNQPES